MMRVLKSRRGVSPVIATVILVATAITIAVAVAYWMGGITSQYTRFEKVEIISVYCESTHGIQSVWAGQDVYYWEITLNLRNTGTTEATLIGAFINGKAISDYQNVTIGANSYYSIVAFDANGDPVYFSKGYTITIEPGSSSEITIRILQDHSPVTNYQLTFTSGTTIELALHSGAGNSYMKMVTLT